jgi:hypothetical protein
MITCFTLTYDTFIFTYTESSVTPIGMTEDRKGCISVYSRLNSKRIISDYKLYD